MTFKETRGPMVLESLSNPYSSQLGEFKNQIFPNIITLHYDYVLGTRSHPSKYISLNYYLCIEVGGQMEPFSQSVLNGDILGSYKYRKIFLLVLCPLGL